MTARFGERDLNSLTSAEVLSFFTDFNQGTKQLTKRTRYSQLTSFFNFITTRKEPSQGPSPSAAGQDAGEEAHCVALLERGFQVMGQDPVQGNELHRPVRDSEVADEPANCKPFGEIHRVKLPSRVIPGGRGGEVLRQMPPEPELDFDGGPPSAQLPSGH